jgi:hypothetical protein
MRISNSGTNTATTMHLRPNGTATPLLVPNGRRTYRTNSPTVKATGPAHRPARLPQGTQVGDTVTVYGRTGVVASMRSMRKGNVVARIACPAVTFLNSPTGLALPACNMYALPPKVVAEVQWAGGTGQVHTTQAGPGGNPWGTPTNWPQPVANGHHYGGRGQYGQDHL